MLLDLITVQYMRKYFASPMKLFGLIGFLVAMLSVTTVVASVVMKIFWQGDMTDNPLLLLGVPSAILSVQCLSVGLLGELTVRIYYQVGNCTNYQVSEFLIRDNARSKNISIRQIAIELSARASKWLF